MMTNMNRTSLLLFVILLAFQSAFVLSFSSITQISSSSRRNVGHSLELQATPGTISGDTTTTKNEIVNALASELLKTCTKYGQIGSKLSEEQREIIDNLASSLAPYSDSAPAQIDLQENHELIYSAAPGASSGALGPLVGKVSQSFLDEVRFINRVELLGGIIKIELNAERKILDENRIRVKFIETAFYIFGNEVKRGEAKGAGVWDYVFSGSVNVDGEKMLLRVMKTPSTFIIVQRE